jgi:hypothetical protein
MPNCQYCGAPHKSSAQSCQNCGAGVGKNRYPAQNAGYKVKKRGGGCGRIGCALSAVVIAALVIGIAQTGLIGRLKEVFPPGTTTPAGTVVATVAAGNNGTISTGKTVAASTTTVQPGGGTLAINKSGDPLDGMVLTIPAGAYPGPTQFRISYAPVEAHTFGKAFNPVTPLISIDNGGQYANGFMQVERPVKVPAGYFAMAFTYDAKTKTLEGLPTIARDSGSLTFATSHFSDILISSIDESMLEDNINTGFTPGKDDWQIPNRGSYITPGGNCAGMSLSAMWYYINKPDGANARLNGLYDNNGVEPATPGFWYDDSSCCRFVSLVQDTYRDTGFEYDLQVAQQVQAGTYPMTYAEHWKMFRYSMQVTHQPQFVSVIAANGIGHAMIVYRIADDKLYVADPNFPGNSERTIKFTGASFEPYNSGLNQAAIEKGDTVSFVYLYYKAQQALIDLNDIGTYWNEFKQNTVGDVEFPDYQIKYKDSSGTAMELTAGTVVSASKIHITVVSTEGDLVPTIYSGLKPVVLDANGDVELKPGDNALGILIQGKVGSGKEYIDYQNLKVTYKASTATATVGGNVIYKLQQNPLITQPVKPSAAGTSATINGNSITYASPDPQVGTITQTVLWTAPSEISPGSACTITFKSIIAVTRADKYTLNLPGGAVETYPQTLTNPWFRVVTTFASSATNLGPAGAFQYSPDGGTTWQTPFTADEAWSRYYEKGMKQVLLPINIWPTHAGNYLTPSASKPLPLQTPPQDSTLVFRLRADLNGLWPDKLLITIIGQATGLSSGGGDSVAAVQLTYVRQ